MAASPTNRPPAVAARERAGLTLEAAARRALVTPGYLRRVERNGPPFNLAIRLARIYGCPLGIFLSGDRGKLTPRTRAKGISEERGRRIAALRPQGDR
jgi:transcriptional regulator with XRE-family HTH domain